MLLRFWGRCDLENLEKQEVSEWLDSWQADAWADEKKLRRHCAWMLFKIDHPRFESGGDGLIEEIPNGVGALFLEKVSLLEKKHGVDALESLRYGEMPRADVADVKPKPQPAVKTSGTGCLFVALMVLGFAGFMALLSGCQLPVRTKAEARRYPVGEPFVVAAPFMEVARYWDEHGTKPVNLGGGAEVRVMPYESLGLAEIIYEGDGFIHALIELQRADGDRTRVHAYEPAPPALGKSFVPGWLDIIRSTPTAPASP